MLFLVATPIGNLDDITARALDTLRRADIIACEDTRRTRKLLSHFAIPTPQILSYRDSNECAMAPRLLAWSAEGRTVAVCSDSGYPGISDPGYRIAHAAAEAGHDYQVIPGASAVPVALLLSGLPTSSYLFKGFPPRKRTAMVRFFAQERDLPHTLVIFESPVRVLKSLEAALEALGNRHAAVCLELTKKFERVQRGSLEQLCTRFREVPARGEVTIVIAGNHPKFTGELEPEPDDTEDD